MLYRLLEAYTLFDRSEEYTERGLTFHLHLLADELETLQQQVQDATRGQGILTFDS